MGNQLFGTAGIRGPLDEVSPGLVLSVGTVVGEMSSLVVLARDGRHSGEALMNAYRAGLQSGGARVIDLGITPTHVLGYAAHRIGSEDEEVMGTMLTASHNPPGDNGIKVFGGDGKEIPSDLEADIEERYSELGLESGPDFSLTDSSWDEWEKTEEREMIDSYLDEAEEYVSDTLDRGIDLRIAVDCGNGVGALTTPQLLERLGAEVVGVNAQIDGSFPGRAPKPQPSTLGDFVDMVEEGNFDLGFAHDGDADRLVVVSPDGIIPEDAIVAALAEEYVKNSDLSDPVVITTPNASGKIDKRVEDAGGSVERTSLGVLPEAIDGRDDVVFAAEPWKHIFPAFGGWIDGSVAAAEVARLASREGGINQLLGDLADISVDKTSLDCTDDDKQTVMDRLGNSLPDEFDASVDTSYGVRLDFDDGRWILVRPSGTEPKIRVYVEGEDDLMERALEVVSEEIEAVN